MVLKRRNPYLESTIHLLLMDDRWRNRLRYWALAVLPLVAIVLGSKLIGSFWFVIFLLFYVFIYRPALDTRRLLSLQAIEEKDAWRFFIPLAVDRIRYTRQLWWG